MGNDNFSKTYVPSIVLETNSDSKVSKVHLKWYLHNGTSYYEVTPPLTLHSQTPSKQISSFCKIHLLNMYIANHN